MTLPSLLRHIGIDVPRGVCVDGRIVTGDAATTALLAGTVTPVAPHMFHGGADLAAPNGLTSAHTQASTWWIDDPVARAADADAVHGAFPSFYLDERDGSYTWSGGIDTGRGRFCVTVAGNPSGGIPAIVPVRTGALGRQEGHRGFCRSEHLYDSGNLCVAEPNDWDAKAHNTVTVIAWAAHWFAAYTDWRLGGPWPTHGYRPHAAA
jgi:hypothetical protein